MIHGLLLGKFTNGRKNTVGITGEENDIFGMTTDGRNL